MSRLYVSDTAVDGSTQTILDGIQRKFGRVPNMMRAMAISPVVLKSYSDFSGDISAGSLGPKLREQIGLLVAQINECHYCLAAHTAVGKRAGLTPSELEQSRQGQASDATTASALRFVSQVLACKGHVKDIEIAEVRAAGYSDSEVLEMIACIALNVFTNYFNSVAEPEIDFPAVPLHAQSEEDVRTH